MLVVVDVVDVVLVVVVAVAVVAVAAVAVAAVVGVVVAAVVVAVVVVVVGSDVDVNAEEPTCRLYWCYSISCTRSALSIGGVGVSCGCSGGWRQGLAWNSRIGKGGGACLAEISGNCPGRRAILPHD